MFESPASHASHEKSARFIPEEKAEVGKRAALPAEHGVVETVLGLHVYCRNLVWELAVWGIRVCTNGRG